MPDDKRPQSAQAQKDGARLFDAPEKQRFVLSLLLAAVVLLLYAQVNTFPFVNYDDGMYVLQNPHVRAGLRWDTVQWAFSTAYANWHPITWLSHALDCDLFRLNAAGHHLDSVLLHALNTILLFWLLARATGRLGPSFVVAALFAVHPINVESVAWIAERKNVLSTTFFLLTLIAYGWYSTRPNWKRYLAVACLFSLGLASKSMLVTLPFVLLLADYWPLRRLGGPVEASPGAWFAPASFARLLAEKLPLLLLSGADSVVTLVAQRQAGAVTTFERFPLTVRIENAVYCYAAYVGKAVWPAHLAVVYPHPGNTLAGWKVLLALLGLLGTTLLVLRLRTRPYLAAGWFYFLGTLVPVIGLVQVGDQAMADRYAYLPLLGIFVMLAWGTADLGSSTKAPGYAYALLWCATLCALGFASHRQIGYWKDSVSLWTHTIAVTGPNFDAENALGGALVQAGRPDEAFLHFQRASLIAPADPVSRADMGAYLHQHGRLREAIPQYEQAIRLTTNPGLLASTLTNLGSAYRESGDGLRARQCFLRSLQLDPGRFNTWLGLGNLASEEGHYDEAVQDFSRSVELEPTAEGYSQLSRVLGLTGHAAEAARANERAVQLSQDKAAAERAARSLAVERF